MEPTNPSLPKRSKPTNPSLPQELITDILVRLPVKYVLKFKCVSKDWSSLISSPHFVKTHLSFSAKDYTRHQILLRLGKSCHILKHCSVSSVCNESVTESFDLDHPIKNLNKFVRIVGSVNGLICLSIRFGGLVLWNPSTRKFKKLPDLLHTQDSDYWCRFAFGYDEVHDDYKVVAMLCRENNRCVDARIYSLKRDHLSRLDDVQYGVMFPDSAKFVNGKLYWITNGGDDWVIVSVDLVDEKCRQLEQPCHEEGIYTLKIGVLGSDISVLCSYIHITDLQKNRVDIWVMKEYGIKESWTKLYTIKNPFDHVNYGPFPPLFMSNKGEILLVLGSTLAIYNPEDDSVRHLEVTNIDSPLVAELYIESLVCPILQSAAMIQH